VPPTRPRPRRRRHHLGRPPAECRTGRGSGRCLSARGSGSEQATAFTEAAGLLERVLPHVSSPRASLLLARMGHLRWLNGEPAAAEQLLVAGVDQLDELGSHSRLRERGAHLGRCRWELDQPDAAFGDSARPRRARTAWPVGRPGARLLADLRDPRVPAGLPALPRCCRAGRGDRRGGVGRLRAHLGPLPPAIGWFGTARD
jgi:hypothetical protein